MPRCGRLLLVTICSLVAAEALAARELVPAAWQVEGGATVHEGAVTLPEPVATASADAGLEGAAERRFLCQTDLRADAPSATACLVLRVQTAGGVYEHRLFEHCQLSADWTSFTESLVFPESAINLADMRLIRTETPGDVQLRGLRLVEDALRHDYRPRPFVSAPADWGPTRPPTGAELLYRTGLASVSCDAWTPLVFCARSQLPLRTVVKATFDLPKSAGEPFVLALGHPDTYIGTPQGQASVVIDGELYRHYSVETNLYSSQWDGQVMLFIRPELPPGKLLRIGYFLSWEGGGQAERWLDAEVVSIPAGPALQAFPVALAISCPWETPRMPGFADLLRRTGITAVEVGDITGYDERRKATFDFLHEQGIRAIGGFSPGWWWTYQTALAKDPDMQAQGVDGQPVPTDHGPAACPSYRGPVYQQQMDLMRVYARYGLSDVSFDEEFFGPGTRICFCPRCRELFDEYRAAHQLVSDVTLEQIAQDPRQHPGLARAWAQFKADLMTQWYVDYRKALEDELALTGRAQELRMYATCQTLAHGAGDVEFQSIMRDNAARLGRGIIQGLLPMPYFYDAYYGGSVRKVGTDLTALQEMWGAYTDGRPSLFPYLLTGGIGMCYVEPAHGLKAQLYEAFTTRAVSGCIFWKMTGLDARGYRELAEGLHALAQVEEFLAEGELREVTCNRDTAAARALVHGDEAALLVTEYSYDPVRVTVEYPVAEASVVEDVETGQTIAQLPTGATSFGVDIGRERARLLRVRTEQPR